MFEQMLRQIIREELSAALRNIPQHWKYAKLAEEAQND